MILENFDCLLYLYFHPNFLQIGLDYWLYSFVSLMLLILLQRHLHVRFVLAL